VTEDPAFCLECFDAAHEGVCPECGVHCASRRRRRRLVGTVRVLYMIVVLLLFFALIGLAMYAFTAGLTAVAKIAPWTIVPIGIGALYLRYKKSEALARSLDDEEERARAAKSRARGEG